MLPLVHLRTAMDRKYTVTEETIQMQALENGWIQSVVCCVLLGYKLKATIRDVFKMS